MNDSPARAQVDLRFSVVIPLYNKGRHVERALASIRAQTLQPAEIIVVDDGSTDGGYELAAAVSGVRMFRRTEPGPGGYAARNVGIQEATSEWIAFLDADDEWLPEHLQRLNELVLSAPGDLVLASSAYQVKHEDGRMGLDRLSRTRPIPGPLTLSFQGLLEMWLDIKGCPIWTSAIVARRSALIEAGLFPEKRCRRGGDKDMWLRIAHLGEVGLHPAPGAIYYRDADNMVTGIKHVNACHCTIESLETLARGAEPDLRQLLHRLANQETYQYGKLTARTDRLHMSAWRGFRPWLDPKGFLILLALSTAPGAALAHRVFRGRLRT
jgi:glycosyltransferase involved in cell wall biosynthesis